MSSKQSFRSRLVTKRTYCRPKEDGTFETWDEVVDRVIGHQQWLWERAKGKPLDDRELYELEALASLIQNRMVSLSGRTLWLGGTSIAKRREASQFNCSFTKVEDVFDVVDCFWLLLQGCGVGFEPVTGTLNGFAKPVEIEIIRSKLDVRAWDAGYRAPAENEVDTYKYNGAEVWHLRIGDSAEAWAKSVGKVLTLKTPVDKIVLDFRRIRAGGIRLKGYGWISSGDEMIAKALEAICQILSKRAGQLLTRMDILDIMNWLGTTLSSRRSAEIALMPFDDPEALEFAAAKKDHWRDNPQRAMSNNSLLFTRKPTKLELLGLFGLMLSSGGSEPGFINVEAAKRRAPWFQGVNPCAEILLGNKSFCNLVEVNMAAFDTWNKLTDAVCLAARANYRQTCVDLRDGVLSSSWHELNQFLRLCGVGLTGVVRFLESGDFPTHNVPEALNILRSLATISAENMARELDLPEPKAVTTVKPSGTLSKVMDTTEGVHRPLGRYIFNNLNFSKHDPLVETLERAGYRTRPNPYDSSGVIVTVPVEYEGIAFTTRSVPEKTHSDSGELCCNATVIQVEVNEESAIDQLDRYLLMMREYVDHNCSITVSYSPEEVPAIVDWLYEHWDEYVGVSFILRTDPTKRAEDLGFPYLPQEVVDADTYREYADSLLPVDLDDDASDELVGADDCASGVCPIR